MFIRQNRMERLGTHFAGADPHDLNQDLIPARETLVETQTRGLFGLNFLRILTEY